MHLCIPDQKSAAAKALLRKEGIAFWWATWIEGRSTLERVKRSGFLNAAAYLACLESLDFLLAAGEEIQPSQEVRAFAWEELKRSPLKAQDALQLGAALAWRRGVTGRAIFVCNDRQLLNAAVAAGFTVASV
jgi:hypothetical protein